MPAPSDTSASTAIARPVTRPECALTQLHMRAPRLSLRSAMHRLRRGVQECEQLPVDHGIAADHRAATRHVQLPVEARDHGAGLARDQGACREVPWRERELPEPIEPAGREVAE